MRSTLAHALLVAGLALVAPAHAQFGVPTPAVQADSHIFSAFTTRTDPNVLAENVTLGPRLREQLGAEPRRRKVYDALMASVAGKPLQSHSLSAAEAAEFTALGLNAADPLVMVEAGEVRLLMQYSIAEKNVTFVEQLANATIAAPAPPPEAKPQAEAPKPEPVVERPLPTEAPPAAVVAPAAVAAPKPAAKAAPKAAAAPKPAPIAKPTVAAPTPPATPTLPAPRVAPVVAAPAAVPTPVTPAKPRGDCVIKPVMTEEDLRICAAEKRSQAVAPREVSAPAGGAAAPAAPPVASVQMQSAPPQPAAAPRECVIKPVMTEDDLRACAAERRSQPVTPKEVSIPSPSAAPAPATAATAAPAAAPVQRECVIKPVMSEEDLRACASVKRSTPMTATEAPAATYAAPPAPTPASAPRECVVKPVMTEDELRACGSRR